MQANVRPSQPQAPDALEVSYPECCTAPSSNSLVILGCTERKRQTSRLLPAIERYDGPAFRVLRKHMLDSEEEAINTSILSGRFGLVSGDCLIPRYEQRVRPNCTSALRSKIEDQLKKTLDETQPERLFVSVGKGYWPLIEEPLLRDVPSGKLFISTGGIGGRASQLSHWLRAGEDKTFQKTAASARGAATLLGTTVRLSSSQILRKARESLLKDSVAARRFETWYVAVGQDRVAPKWLVSNLFEKPVSRFRTADARRVLNLLGVPCLYADRD